MAELPDLDTRSIGHIAYWNAIDQGTLPGVNPDEVLSANGVRSSTLYDNGVEGTFQTLTGRNCSFRVKNDGWFVVWFDQTTTYQNSLNNSTEVAGRHDLVNNWTEYSQTGGIVKNTLERVINALWNELSNSANVQYSPSDSGLYNYEFSGATATTLLTSNQGVYGESNGEYSHTYTDGFLYTAETDPYAVDFYFSLLNIREESQSRLTVCGAEVLDTANSGNNPDNNRYFYGAYDLWNSNLVPNAGTEYEIYHELGRDARYEKRYDEDQVGIVAVWGE